jgi:two-component system chemotaxis sensor kinase CheA
MTVVRPSAAAGGRTAGAKLGLADAGAALARDADQGMPVSAAPTALRQHLQQIGLELATLEMTPERSTAALAAVVEAAAATAGAPPEITAALGLARTWTTAGRGAVSAETRSRLADWHGWMEQAVTAWERGRQLPAWPADLPRTEPPSRPVVPRGAAGEQAVPLLPGGIDADMMQLFCTDCEDFLRDIEQGVLVLEDRPDDPETLNTVFRAFHTFKGNAGMLKLVVLQRVAHELESLLDSARRGRLRLGRGEIDVILAGADLFSRYVAAVSSRLAGRDTADSVSLPAPAVIDAAQALLANRDATPQPAAAPAATTPHPAMASPVEAAPPAVDAVVEPAPGVAIASAPSGPTPPPRPGAPSGSVRVDTGKLDGLIDLVGELVIAQSMVTQHPAVAAAGDEQLARSLAQLRGVCSELQRTATALRMVPIRGTFQKMTRLVRDVAAQLGKEIRLVLDGEETELDRSVIEEIGDPLVHMIRNSADHGIESPADRVAAGKPAGGTITLRAYHQGGFVVIEVADDGRGLDPARIRRTAVQRGLIRADEQLGDREVLDLIFAPGFSTAERVSDVSGRGVGMDVVRRNIERIRGKVEIDSTPGLGTTFTIFMPLTLAIIEGLLVAVGDQRFVIPALAVRESFRPLPGAVTTVQGRGELVAVRNRLVPLLRLGRHFGIEGACDAPGDGIVVVAEAGQETRCLLVDSLVGKQEVVIKSLGETFPPGRGFAGAAILGDGRVGLILDTTALVRMRTHTTETAA